MSCFVVDVPDAPSPALKNTPAPPFNLPHQHAASMNRPTPGKRRRLPTSVELLRAARRPPDTDHQTRSLDPLCRLWALRAMVELGAIDELSRGDAFSAPQLLEFVGVQPAREEGDPEGLFVEFDRKAALRQARQRLREQSAPGVAVLPEDSIAARHLAWLRAELSLTELQAQVLLLCVMVRRNVHLGVAMCALGDLSTLRLYSVLATVLGTSVEAAAKAMERTGTLAVSGLARVDHNGQYEFPAKIDLLHGVTERLLVDHADRFSLFADNFVMAGTPRLTCERFDHLGGRLAHLKAYLGQAVRAGTAGVNVLVYGPPGTGKTELSRALAAALQVQLFEVSVVSAQGQRIPGRKRLAAFELTQQILARRGQSVVLFDEIEDIDEVAGDDDDDDDTPRPLRRPASGRKGWFNRLLETNPVPAIWVTNRIGHIDAAHLRRFDLHLQMDTPPSAVRSAMLAEQTAELGTTPAWCRRMAAHTRLAPGVITRAARVVSSIRSAGVETPAEALLEEVIGASLTAQRIGQALPAGCASTARPAPARAPSPSTWRASSACPRCCSAPATSSAPSSARPSSRWPRCSAARARRARCSSSTRPTPSWPSARARASAGRSAPSTRCSRRWRPSTACSWPPPT